VIRTAAVAGQFYPRDQEGLLKAVGKLVDATVLKQEARCVVMPHAGYLYSGPVAGKTISHVNVKDTVLILGPNHTGLGLPYSIISEGAWETPLGEVKIDSVLAKLMLQGSEFIKIDENAHMFEHSIEVELPFLQYFNKDLSIVPMVISDFNLQYFKSVGEEIARAIKQHAKPTLIVASTDMTHYQPHDIAKNKDAQAIEAILKLDVEGLRKTIKQLNVSMCGFAPVAVAIYACSALGAKKAELIDYKTSGDITGDYSNVVGYAGIIIK